MQENSREEVLKEFLSECSEVHALWYGFYTSFMKIRRDKLPKEARSEIDKEYHYFALGHVIGRIVQAVIVAAGVKIVV